MTRLTDSPVFVLAAFLVMLAQGVFATHAVSHADSAGRSCAHACGHVGHEEPSETPSEDPDGERECAVCKTIASCFGLESSAPDGEFGLPVTAASDSVVCGGVRGRVIRARTRDPPIGSCVFVCYRGAGGSCTECLV